MAGYSELDRYANEIDFSLISGETPSEPAFFARRQAAGTRFPQRMSTSGLRPKSTVSEPAPTLEQHIRAGFPPDLALDLVLHELVVRAAEATRADAVALALIRGDAREDEMVCRAASGTLAPGLGIPLNTSDGLSGACFKMRQPQSSVDTQFDPRVDPAIVRQGIRSIAIVPIFESAPDSPMAGMLEAFSSLASAFSITEQRLLEDFARECSAIRRESVALAQKVLVEPSVAQQGVAQPATHDPAPQGILQSKTPASAWPASPPRRQSFELWTLALGALAICAIIAVSFLIGSRIGWLRQSGPISSGNAGEENTANAHGNQSGCAAGDPSCSANRQRSNADHNANPSAEKKAKSAPTNQPSPDELVVYEKGKVIFRMKARQKTSESASADSVVEASSKTKMPTSENSPPKPAAGSIWLSPAQAETRLLSRTEPQYPAQALADHRSGSVLLEVQVAEDGSVSDVKTVSGDPLLAGAAADAIRNWHYQPYRQHGRASQFQTDVTMRFSLPD
jgi:TonB family protein